MIRIWRSPVSGKVLERSAPHLLTCPGERWPVIDDIAYLRAGSAERAEQAAALLDAGERTRALALLLAENDPWWDGPVPAPETLLALAANPQAYTLRAAMAQLGYGRVADYFAHRWSDPTYLAGLALLEAHWPAPASAFELACGIGHYLRALQEAGVAEVLGGDIVFGKLWLARHYVAPRAQLVCFDADGRWPCEPRAELSFCHDALYFLREQAAIARQLQSAGTALCAVAHVHNREAHNYSAGAAVTRAQLEALFPEAILFDDAELTRAGAEGTPARPGPAAGCEALSLVTGPGARRPAAPCALLRPRDALPLVRNPLLSEAGVRWPSERYRDEYGHLITYRGGSSVPVRAAMSAEWSGAVRRRELLDLPERW